jgi:hypothetical protein
MSTKKELAPTEDKKSLVALADIAYQIKRVLMETGGELTPELEKAMAEVESKMPDKADSYVFVTQDLRNEAALWKKRAQDFAAVARTFENYADAMEESIKFACVKMNVTELEGAQYIWKLVKSKAAVMIDDETKIPSGHIEIVQTRKIRKDSIYEDLKNGLPVPGARLVENQHVRAYANTAKGKK